MTLVPVNNLWFPDTVIAGGNYNASNFAIDATGEKYAWVGEVWWPDRSVTSRAIRSARFLLGTVVKAGGSAWTFSLQDISTTTGPPGQPDGTQDQTVAIANGDAGFVTNANYTTGNLSGDRTVAYGERLCAVIEFDGAGRLGSDSVQLAHATFGNNNHTNDGPVQFTAAWASAGGYNSIVLNFADGTQGLMQPAVPISSQTVSSPAFNTGTTPDEVALAWTPTFNCKVDGIWFCGSAANTGDMELVVYDAGGSALRTVAIDANSFRSTGYHIFQGRFAELTLTAGVTYYFALKPTTANTFNYRFYDCATNGILQLMAGNSQAYFASRTNAGSWTILDTRRPMGGAIISAIDDGAGGAGGVAAKILGGSIV